MHSSLWKTRREYQIKLRGTWYLIRRERVENSYHVAGESDVPYINTRRLQLHQVLINDKTHIQIL